MSWPARACVHVWNVDTDTLSLKSTKSSIIERKHTKRTTLKEVAEVFDQLGLFSPVTIQGKLLLQDLWKKRLSWDDELDEEDCGRWKTIHTELIRITESSIPRSIAMESLQQDKRCKLLCFCDASSSAYAAAVYLHQVSDGISLKLDLHQ